MEDKTRELLDKAIEAGFSDLSSADEARQEIAVDNVVNLYKLKIEEDRNIWDSNEKYDRRVMEEESHDRETELKEKQMKEQSLDRWINVGVQAGLTLFSIIAYNCWFNRGLKFNETGTITDPMTKNLLSKMLPKK